MENLIKETVEKCQKDLAKSGYTKYLKGKKVVIVGPDTTMIGSKKGEEIEGYDVIIRINTAYDYMPFSEELIKDIGSRTDVLYQCPSSMKPLWKDTKLKEKMSSNKIRYICYQNGNKDGKYMTGKYVYPDVEEAVNKIITTLPKAHLHYSHSSCQHLCSLLSSIGGLNIVTRTGLLAIWDSLVHQAGSIKVEGMSFYNGGGHMFRTVTKPLDPLKNHKHEDSGHNSIVELQLLKELVSLYADKIKTDLVL